MKRARIQRKGKQFVLPCRHNSVDVPRDQECLDAVPKNVFVEEAEKAVAEIRKQREDELRSSGVEETDVKAAKRARIKRSGKDFYLPVRTSKEALARDQAFLNAVPKNVSLQEAEEAVSKIRRQREVETAGGEVEGSSQGKEGGEEAALSELRAGWNRG